MEMGRREFIIFIATVYYAPLMIDPIKDSLESEKLSKPQAVRLQAHSVIEVGGHVAPPAVRRIVET